MKFLRYYIYRNESKKALIYKIIIVLTAIAMCLPFFARYNTKYIVGGCAKDAIFVLMGRFVFPMLELISVIFYIRLALRDNNQNVVIRYGSKRRIWIYQSIGGLLYSLECVLLIYAASIGSGIAYFGTYDKWMLEGSKYYRMVIHNKWPFQMAVTQFQMYLFIVGIKTFITNITINISLLFNYITGSTRVAILIGIIICGLDFIAYMGSCGLFELEFVNFYSMEDCILKVLIAFLADAILFLIGVYMSGFREYLGKR